MLSCGCKLMISHSLRSANKCLVKVGHMAAQLQQFEKAALLFEEVYSSIVEHLS